MRCKILSIFFLALLLASGCAGQSGAPPPNSTAASTASLEERAASEATAIIARARATALVLQAQAEATAVMQQVNTLQVAQAKDESVEIIVNEPEISAESDQTPAPGQEQASTGEDEYRIELLDITYAGEGGFIMVRFRATRKAADDLWPGRVSLTDEVTGTAYNSVPLMPVVGLLIGRPRSFGPIGYIMFYNVPPGLPPGSLVTVQLGQFMQEHVQVASK